MESIGGRLQKSFLSVRQKRIKNIGKGEKRKTEEEETEKKEEKETEEKVEIEEMEEEGEIVGGRLKTRKL